MTTPATPAAPATTQAQVEPQKPVEGTPAAAAPAAAAPATPAADKSEPATAAPAAAKVVPDKYDLKLPKDSPLDAAHADKVASFAKERGLSQEEAQAVLERDHANTAAYLEKTKVGLKTQSETWIKDMANDPEIGGEAYKQNAELSKRFVHKFFSEQFRNMLDDTGLGNHPELVRGFVRAAKQMGEDQLVIPGAQSGGRPSMEDKFYPSHNKQ